MAATPMAKPVRTPTPGQSIVAAISRAARVTRARRGPVGDQHLRFGCGRAADYLVVVGCHSDHPQVTVAFDEGAHALPHDQVVVGEQDRDRPLLSVLVAHVPSCARPVRFSAREQAQRSWWWNLPAAGGAGRTPATPTAG
jgi:hypothetical protein